MKLSEQIEASMDRCYRLLVLRRNAHRRRRFDHWIRHLNILHLKRDIQRQGRTDR